MSSSTRDVIKTINHYKKSLEVPGVDEKRVRGHFWEAQKCCFSIEVTNWVSLTNHFQILHCIGVLYKLGVTVNVLQETGIGRTVNGLCKSEAGEVRTAAKSLVNKWKALVVNESEDEPARQSHEEDQKNHQHQQERHGSSHRKDSEKIKKERDSRSHHNHHHHRGSSSSKREGESKHHHHRERQSMTNGTSETVKATSPEKPPKESSKRSSSKSDSHRPGDKDPSRKRHGEEHGGKDRSSKRHRTEGHSKRDEQRSEEDEVEIDGSAGTSFADALAMMDGGGGTPAKHCKAPTSSATRSIPRTSTIQSNSAGSADSAAKPLTKGSSSCKSGSSQPGASSSKSHSQSKKGVSGGSSRPSDVGSGPPMLLSSSVKLAPLLDPDELKKDIMAPSVVISNSYTPTSYLNPVNMVGVSAAIMKNKRPVGAAPPPVIDSNNFEILQSKARTKVYSGNKCAATVLSLHEMCIRVLQKNVDALEYTGGVPFDILEPILLKCSAIQLDQIEYFNPYLAEDTNDLWKVHVSRQYRGKKRQEMESWREMFQVSQAAEFEWVVYIHCPDLIESRVFPAALSRGGAGPLVQSDRVHKAVPANVTARKADQNGIHGPPNAAHGPAKGNGRWRRYKHWPQYQCLVIQQGVCQWHEDGIFNRRQRGAGQTSSPDAKDTGADEEGDKTITL